MDAATGPYAPPLWLVTSKYEDAPKKQKNANVGTTSPIPKHFESPWIGQTIDELGLWLKAKPGETDLNERHFAILDMGAKDDPSTVVCCRIGDHGGKGDGLFILRKESKHAGEHLAGAPTDAWDEEVRLDGSAEIRYEDGDGDA